MSQPSTHREVKRPAISARHLADYMAASPTAQRTIARDCKYQKIARVTQHTEAMAAVAKHLRDWASNPGALLAKAQELRNRQTQEDFERSTWDVNAAFLERFADVFPDIEFPNADRAASGPKLIANLSGVKVTATLGLRLHRVDRRSNLKIGGVMIRYAKGKALADEVGAWQSALLFGLLSEAGAGAPDRKLCLTVDAHSGKCHPAPGDAARRFSHMIASCEALAERWPNIKPPANAVF
jgi:hypothetical protein